MKTFILGNKQHSLWSKQNSLFLSQRSGEQVTVVFETIEAVNKMREYLDTIENYLPVYPGGWGGSGGKMTQVTRPIPPPAHEGGRHPTVDDLKDKLLVTWTDPRTFAQEKAVVSTPVIEGRVPYRTSEEEATRIARNNLDAQRNANPRTIRLVKQPTRAEQAAEALRKFGEVASKAVYSFKDITGFGK